MIHTHEYFSNPKINIIEKILIIRNEFHCEMISFMYLRASMTI